MKRYLKTGLPVAVLLLIVGVNLADAQMFGRRNPFVPDLTYLRFLIIAGSGAVGFGLGWLASPEAARVRLVVGAVTLGAAALIAVAENGAIGWGLTPFVALAAFMAGFGVWFARTAKRLLAKPTTFGDAQWATIETIEEAGLLQNQTGIKLGFVNDAGIERPVVYSGDRHIWTSGPTRFGKGTDVIIPNLLTYEGSTLVIDPKGENAMITAKRRKDMGQDVYILDPWHITASAGLEVSRYNPMNLLDPADIDFAEKSMMMGDSLTIPSGGDNKFWDESTKAVLQGMCGHVASHPVYEGRRDLGTVRDLLMLDAEELKKLATEMLESPHHFIAAAGARLLQMDEKLLSNILASAQAQTTMLDSPRLRESLSASDFSFADMKTKQMTVYLVLPSDRLQTFSRWLRLLIQQAIKENAQNIEVKPKQPILFILDEMPVLGNMSIVKEAFGLMAGYGMRLWAISQDASQLKDIYGDSWESFISNAGVLQYFGSRDRMTSEYFSALCGETTVWNFSTALSRAVSTSSSTNGSSRSESESETETASAVQRKLIYPDQLMRMKRDRQLLLIENLDPIIARRTPWYRNPDLRDLGNNLHK
ncbi:type IV secretory system conjugative DNA transfer family protein [Brucella anthropi]|uniref:type IV secretory system conjugative DNA transfer family protein n=1 Tax=Brucella anthropi TaxID=529 RepID=UPI00236315A8|nr:type IV secretory system conjugative DNA transfer family protein [Brucella anthropi]